METNKENIIQTASRLFHKSGVRNVTIDEVCSELRISKKTLYLHFKNKEELIAAVIEDVKKQNFDKFERNLVNRNAIDSLIFIVKELKKHADCEPHQLWFDIQKYYPKVFDKHEKEHMETIRLGFTKNLVQGIAEGYYRADLDIEMATYYHAMHMRNTFELMQENERKFSKKRMMDFYIDLIVHLIANEKGMKYLEENYYNSEKK
ncbi:MAG: TetR/AcrR family transcriptional regulator [Paludibacter sp.]|nr:TetR/AcrR family transcriptional regulator [Paludibacter sp.]